MFQTDNFLLRSVTVNEKWIHYNSPEIKQQLTRLVFPGKSTLEMVGLLTNRVIATIFSVII